MASPAELHARTNGTKWTNKQLLFHMLFGFVLVRVLLVLVKGLGRLPAAISHTFAAVLNAGTRPFHLVNYLGALPGGLLGVGAMSKLMDYTIGHLRASLARESHATSPSPCTSRSDGSVLQERDDRRRCLQLPDPALRPSPPTAHPRHALEL